uniref:Xaa-Pro aminopeptidase n=1 Tax=Candidatus Kentrum sp. DK TaxID=2126562 RepID=A0A450TCM3_9GAMM|nr:MAG: aminopeptidase P Metallo peptidase. MEROPS family M24B [Candidatus Kentron sp. DK]
MRNSKELKRRRRRLMDLMGEEGIAILPSGPTHVRNRDVAFPFRPDSDFFYLTGFHEPEALAVLAPGRSQGEFLLFCRERDPKQEKWIGSRAGLEGACERFGADDAFPIGDVDDILPGLMENRTRVFHAVGTYPEFDRKMSDWLGKLRAKSRQGNTVPSEFLTFDHLLHDMRLIKSPHEIELMRKAVTISAEAHRRAMALCRPGLTEYQVEAELMHEFIRSGSRATAYPPIVAAGSNSCVLHYMDNHGPLKNGDLLLIDAAAEYDCYAADITRTFPVGGRFKPAQREIYELVLASQEAAIDKARPGNHWNDMHEAVVRVLTEGLREIGLLKGRVATLIKKEKYKKYFMHRTGHWLGLDVHDVGNYKVDDEWRLLEPGMALTVEPGLYIPGGDDKIPKKWWNIGVRIEDDILITRDGPEILSAHAPRGVEEIEALVGSDSSRVK